MPVPSGGAIVFATRLGCRLPSEAEWEYSCRGNTTTLFFLGDRLLNYHKLNAWLDVYQPEDKWRPNPFGLYGLFCGDFCLDSFKVSHSDSARVKAGTYVIKGGGSQFWPWQDEEWVWCMPAMRIPSSALSKDRRCAFRLVKDLPHI
jgi:hypothetical protein